MNGKKCCDHDCLIGIGETIARAIQKKVRILFSQGVEQKRLESLKTDLRLFPNQKSWTFPLILDDMTMVKTVCSEILETMGQIDIGQ